MKHFQVNTDLFTTRLKLTTIDVALSASAIPYILPTVPSPLQYGYRTKITPHFDAPQKFPRRRKGKEQPPLQPLPKGTSIPIGFNKVGKREVMDIEVHFETRTSAGFNIARFVGVPNSHINDQFRSWSSSKEYLGVSSSLHKMKLLSHAFVK